MSYLEFCISFRKEIIEIISGVKNSSSSLWWDDTQPNYFTKTKISSLVDLYIKKAGAFGVYVITRHHECSNKTRTYHCVYENPYNFSIDLNDSKYTMPGDVLFYGNRFCRCPCTNTNKPAMHLVSEVVFLDKNEDTERCSRLAKIINDVCKARNNSESKMPRSGIREYLLRAIINLNDEILPQSVDEYIASIRRPQDSHDL